MQTADFDNRNIERWLASDPRFHPRQVLYAGIPAWEINFHDPATGETIKDMTQAEALKLRNDLEFGRRG